MLRSCAVFLGVLGSLMVILHWASSWVETVLTSWTAQATAAALRLLGADARTEGPFVLSSVLTFRVVTECTAVYPAALFLAAVVAFPCPLRRKLLGLALGVPALLMINIVRLVSMCYVDRWFPDLFEVFHLVVWQALIIFFVLFIWLVWAALAVQRDELEAD